MQNLKTFGKLYVDLTQQFQVIIDIWSFLLQIMVYLVLHLNPYFHTTAQNYYLINNIQLLLGTFLFSMPNIKIQLIDQESYIAINAHISYDDKLIVKMHNCLLYH